MSQSDSDAINSTGTSCSPVNPVSEKRYQMVLFLYSIGKKYGIGTFQQPDFISIIFGRLLPSKFMRSDEDINTAVKDWCSDPIKAEWMYGRISTWNVSRVADMSGLFSGKRSFNEDLSSWDMSAVTKMGRMFRDATAFNRDLSSWDVSSVTNMYDMLGGCQIPADHKPSFRT